MPSFLPIRKAKIQKNRDPLIGLDVGHKPLELGRGRRSFRPLCQKGRQAVWTISPEAYESLPPFSLAERFFQLAYSRRGFWTPLLLTFPGPPAWVQEGPPGTGTAHCVGGWPPQRRSCGSNLPGCLAETSQASSELR